METPRMTIVWNVLEAAKDNADVMVVAAFRRLIWANTLGWKRHATAEDKALVFGFAE